MNDEKWVAWAIQTSRKWADVEDILKYTNIDFIDNDHRILIEYALDLNRVITKAQTSFTMDLIHETKDVLNRFYEYAVDHFHREEIFMEFYMLPNVEAHKHEHNRILSILRRALDDFESGKVKVSVKLKMQVMDWLIKHVNIIDYNFFDINNWSNNLVNASHLDEIKPIIHLTGVGDIDHQHMTLTGMAIDLIHEVEKVLSDDEIIKCFDDFINYAKYHFEYEHQFMMKYSIAEMQDHLKEHDYFINKLTEYKHEALEKKMDLNSVKRWTLTWWIKHINLIDRKYFSFKSWASDVIEKAHTMDEVRDVLRLTGIEEVDQDHLALMEIIIKLNNEIRSFEAEVLSSKTAGGKKTLKDLNTFMTKGKIPIENMEDLHQLQEDQKATVIKYLDEAFDIAKTHFQREERIMENRGISDLSAHKKEHILVLQNLKGIKENYESGLLDISSNIKKMILDWWIEHTNTTDFRTFVQRNETIFNNIEAFGRDGEEEGLADDAGPTE